MEGEGERLVGVNGPFINWFHSARWDFFSLFWGEVVFGRSPGRWEEEVCLMKSRFVRLSDGEKSRREHRPTNQPPMRSRTVSRRTHVETSRSSASGPERVSRRESQKTSVEESLV